MVTTSKADFLKLSLLAIGAAFCAALSGCAPQANATPVTGVAAQANSDARDSVATSPLALHAVRVQQYADQTPRDANAALPATVTLIEFETDLCEVATDADFAVSVDLSGATVIDQRSRSICDQPQRQTFHVSTVQAPAGRPIAILNPLMIDPLPAVN